jgi:menaquinone-dependent protoporphyrinogen oxidase
MKRKILVAYASRAGSTSDVAQAIAEQICAMGFDAVALPVKSVKNINNYDAVILGSAVYYGTWLPEMLKFITEQQQLLNSIPTAIFSMHMQATDNNSTSHDKRETYTQAIRGLINPFSKAFFAGKVDPASLPWFKRLAVKWVKSPIGDMRDWEKIRNWTSALGLHLQEQCQIDHANLHEAHNQHEVMP